MWGQKREPSDYCVAHFPDVYANLPVYVVHFTRYVISDIPHDTRVHGYAAREERFQAHII